MPSTLSSSSTDAQVRAALDDNASFEEDASTTKAQAYLTALRIWRRRLSEMASASFVSQSYTRDLKWVDDELLRTQSWVEENKAAVNSSNEAWFTRGRAV